MGTRTPAAEQMVSALRSLTIIRGGPHQSVPVRWEEGGRRLRSRYRSGTLRRGHRSGAVSDGGEPVEAFALAGSRRILMATGTLGARGAGTLLRRVDGRSERIPIRERDACLVSAEHFVASVLDGVRSLRASEAVVRASRRGRGVAP